MKRTIAIVLTVLLIATTGCRSHKHLSKGNANDSTAVSGATVKPEEKPVRLDTIQNVSFKYYTANFSCTVDNIEVSGQIRMTHDSVIWISVSKIIELGRVMLTPTRVQGYAKVVNKYFDGTYADLRQRYGIDIDYATMEALLLANCPKGCVKSKEPRQDNDTVTLWYNQKSPVTGTQRELTLKKDFNSKRLTSINAYTPSTNQRLQLNYCAMNAVVGQLLPSEIEVKLKSSQLNTKTRITISKITLNQPQSYPFSIPKKYQKL